MTALYNPDKANRPAKVGWLCPSCRIGNAASDQLQPFPRRTVARQDAPDSDEHRPAPKVRWSRFVKSVVYTTITNARPPKCKSIARQNRIQSLGEASRS